MKFKLIEQNTKKSVGELNLKFLPREKEYIEFKNKTYSIYKIIHTEFVITLKVRLLHKVDTEFIVEYS